MKKFIAIRKDGTKTYHVSYQAVLRCLGRAYGPKVIVDVVEIES